MKTAVIQYQAGDNREANVARAARLVKKAISRRAKFILLPEVFVYRGNIKTRAQLSRVVEFIPGKSLRPFQELARQGKVYILAGSVYEKAGDGRAFNTSVLIGPRGNVAACYRKRNLFKARLGSRNVNEAALFRAGIKNVVAAVGGFKVGLSVCYDLRFPQIYQQYAQAGVQILCIPSAFTKKTGQAHWEVLLRARAIENACYVLAPNQFGKDTRGIVCYGNSMIIDPWGKILARASGHKEEIIYAEIHKDNLNKMYAVLPGMKK